MVPRLIKHAQQLSNETTSLAALWNTVSRMQPNSQRYCCDQPQRTLIDVNTVLVADDKTHSGERAIPPTYGEAFEPAVRDLNDQINEIRMRN
jgi:hypothetical protein